MQEIYLLCHDQPTLKIIFVVRLKRRQEPRRVFLLRAAENLAVITSYRPTDLFQASFELELHEGSYPVFTRPHHFEVLVLVNCRHFQKSDKENAMACVYLTWSLQRSSVIQALSGSLVAHSSRSFDRCLLHWRPPCSALGRFLGRLYSTYSLALPWCLSRPVMLLLFGRCGHRQICTVTRFQAHPSGFMHWA